MVRLRSHTISTLGENIVVLIALPFVALMAFVLKYAYEMIAFSF